MPKRISDEVQIASAAGGYAFLTGVARNPEIELAKDIAIEKSWSVIRPMVENAITDKMRELGVPAEEEHRTTLNHFKNNSICLSNSYVNVFLQGYMDTLLATGKEKAGQSKVFKVNAAILSEKYCELRDEVATYGHLETAHTDDGRLASQIISDFTDRNSAPLEQADILHLDIEKASGPTHEDLTKLKLEEEFLKTIELEGLKVAMAYLKREYGMDVDIDPAQFADLPTRPDDPPRPKAKRRVG